MESSREYTITDVIEAAREAAANGLHTAMPGVVLKYYPKGVSGSGAATADIQPACKQPMRDADGGTTHVRLPVFSEVPIAWPSGGGFFVSFPITAGDPCMLIFSEVAAGEYLVNGAESEPLDTRRHSLGYPIAIPGAARPDNRGIVDANATSLIIGKDGAATQIKITGTTIELGKGAGLDFVALAAKVDAIMSLIKTHTHPVAGALASISADLSTITTVAATITKAV